jgi:S-DNA-T family DNA segregation ATPase FtsK/SpoIIIE
MSYTPALKSPLLSSKNSKLSSNRPFAARFTTLPFTPTGNRRLNEFVGLVLLVSAALLLLALVSYKPTDASFNTVSGVAAKHAVQNWAGPIGANTSDLLLQFEGAAALLLPFLLGSLGWSWLRSRATSSPWAKLTGVALYVVFAPAFFGLLPGDLHWMGAIPLEGLTGRLIVDFLVGYLNFPGTCVVVLSILAVSLYLSTAFSFTDTRSWLAVKMSYWYAWRDRVAANKMAKARNKALKRAEKEEAEYHAAAGSPGFIDEPGSEATPGRLRSFFAMFGRSPKSAPVIDAAFFDDNEAMPATRQGGFAETAAPYADAYLEPPAPPQSLWETMPRAQVADPAPEPESDFFASIDARAGTKNQAQPEPPAAPNKITFTERADIETRSITTTARAVSGFRLPPSSLLHRSEDMAEVREEELREEARVLVEKCAEFDVGGQVTQINPGPVVTTFEFRPEAGVKYSRVTGLADDLCLAMAAESILIERMAGKSTVGIQVPNSTRETIWLRDVVESENFVSSKSKLILAMGKDINGRIVTADLATMPHVLIAGSTGSGKSVAINAMIMSILFKNTPEQVRMILVDPKRVELGMYEGIPHLFTPIITEPKLAANALRNAVREMERRLKLLASRSVRNIDQYNKLFDAGTPSLFKDELEDENPLPYIIIIIDELADLMMLDKSNVEEAITRLAQMARAVGIHLVLATQRPSVDVITGLIKANVPTRMSFRLATKVDSRTILDANGAESLLGRGDMLFLPPGTSRVQRVHAPFVTETEISAVVDFWKSQGQAEYVEAFLESPKDDKGRELDANEDGADDSDELFDDGVRLVFEFGKASTSLLQRRLRIGYGRAAHLIDMMERDGLVGPADGSKPRELLKSAAWLNEVGQESR